MRAHGTRARYVFGAGPGQDRSKGCRCELCCEANRAYARFQGKRKRLEGLQRTEGPWASPFVDAGPARAHILALASARVGYKRVAELAGVGKTAVLNVRSGKRTRITRKVAEAILAVPLAAAPANHQLVDANPTWQRVERILRMPGWSKARLSAVIGQGGRALQLGAEQVTQRNAEAIKRVYDDIFWTPEVQPRVEGSRSVVETLLELLGEAPQPWWSQAACRDPELPAEIFFPTRGESLEPARAVCSRCPVASECREYALRSGEHFGVWGGLGERERRGHYGIDEEQVAS